MVYRIGVEGNRETPGFWGMLARWRRGRRKGIPEEQQLSKKKTLNAPEWPHNGKAVRAGDGAGGSVLTKHALVLSAALGRTGMAPAASALTCQKLHIIKCPNLSPCFLFADTGLSPKMSALGS